MSAEESKVVEAEEAGERVLAADGGVGHPLDPKGGTLAGKLPGGYRDAAGVVHRTFVVRELSGREEDLLGGKGVWVARLDLVIANCLVAIGTIQDRREIAQYVQRMPLEDRKAILIALYRLSHGDAYVFRKLACPEGECQVEGTHSVDLCTLAVRDMAQPGQLDYETQCPSGRVVRWHIMTGADEAWMYEVGKQRRDAAPFSLGLLARITEIDGGPVVRGTGGKGDKVFDAALAQVQGLTASERRLLREEIEDAEGEVDTAVTFTCGTCQHQWEGFIPVGWPNLFFPQVRQRR